MLEISLVKQIGSTVLLMQGKTTYISSVFCTYLGHKSPRLFFIFMHGSQKCSDPEARDLGDHVNVFRVFYCGRGSPLVTKFKYLWNTWLLLLNCSPSFWRIKTCHDIVRFGLIFRCHFSTSCERFITSLVAVPLEIVHDQLTLAKWEHIVSAKRV